MYSLRCLGEDGTQVQNTCKTINIRKMDAIRAGTETGAITQNPVGIGYKCVEAAVKAYNGEELPPMIDTGFYWYDADNIDDDEIQAVLYE